MRANADQTAMADWEIAHCWWFPQTSSTRNEEEI
jgi:hypothetical protein